ncbi:CCAAT/enhancer-binding protein zeta [Morella rubra]|uniref:CCAAT/enhancer-binding protein zeta n=1 Tax=Morella rubra TaxID=262757 RepID=A0A6A1VZD8_9ROSI|nr:CCAAT/enhancer-binding protein zeta [Morella rubra]
MAVSSKSKKPSNNLEDIDNIRSDVASFASSLGLSSSILSSSSGFNDSDFRKTGPLKSKPTKLHKRKTQNTENTSENNEEQKAKEFDKPRPTHNQKPKVQNFNTSEKNKSNQKTNDQKWNTNGKPKPKASVLALDENEKQKGFDKFKNLPKLPLMKANGLGVWYMDAADLEAEVVGEGKRSGMSNVEQWKSVVEKKRMLGERLMAQYTKDYEASRGQSGDIKMLAATQRSGTAADKVSAFSVMVGDNPIANLRSLDALLGMVASKVGKRHALTGFEALKELFVSSLLPDRKLKSLLQRPVDNLPETKDGYSLLLFWYWEECLKQRYEHFIFALEEASRDMLPALKHKALKTMYSLLKSKSEQERRLLSALVNKLGDPENKGASNADFHLANLLSDHPNMKAVVIDEVDSFLFRPRLGLRAKYHAVNFLSQIRLSHKGDGPKVAKHLIDVYFGLFKVLITEAGADQKFDKSGKALDKKANSYQMDSKDSKSKSSSETHVELDSRLLSALLTGVNRAFPFVLSNEADDIIEVQTPMLFQLVHSKNFNVGVQALMLLDKISSKNQIVSDRFYRALYAKLLLPAALNSSKAMDVEALLCSDAYSFSLQKQENPKAEMFIGLLLRAMKTDVNLKRVGAFAKRVLQVALQQPPQYACGCLFLLSEVFKARPPLWNMVLQNESVDEELEHFEDIVEETDQEPTTASKKEESDSGVVNISDAANSDSESSEHEDESPASNSEDDVSDEAEDLLMRNDSKDLGESKIVSGHNELQPQVPSKKSLLPGGYDPRHREPSYCNADRASWWELMVLASHVHPSVATMAQTLLSGANIVYDGNPLNDLALTAFLDKFMEKKPKASTWHGGSQIEPARKLDMNNLLIGPEILSLAEVDVPPEDLVFHKFYVNKMNSSKKPKKKKKKKAAEEEAARLKWMRVWMVGMKVIMRKLRIFWTRLISPWKQMVTMITMIWTKLPMKMMKTWLAMSVMQKRIFPQILLREGILMSQLMMVQVKTTTLIWGLLMMVLMMKMMCLTKGKEKVKSGVKAAASPFASLEDYEHLH